jgi:molybdopterin/thiamine biosynthesis adenylyltransferase
MRPLNEEDLAIYEWQLDVPNFGKQGQQKLKNATALVSRAGGLGGALAMQLAAAGFGKIILAHEGNLKHSDLNRQILMTQGGLDKLRVEQAKETLNRFKPNIEVEAINSNFNESNAQELVAKADIVFDCAPLFEERFLMNRECVYQAKPLVDCAMFNMEGQLMNILPGITPCLQCLFPEKPPHWKRKFPVFGAVASLVASLGAIEGIKIIAGMPGVLTNQMLYINSNNLSFQKIPIKKNPSCKICSQFTKKDSK